MKIPDQKPFGRTQDSWTREGSKSKNSAAFLSNYDEAFKDRKSIKGHVKIVYTNGKRYEIPNPATHGEEGTKALDAFVQETGGLHNKIEKIIE
jgi:hypothetical protein